MKVRFYPIPRDTRQGVRRLCFHWRSIKWLTTPETVWLPCSSAYYGYFDQGQDFQSQLDGKKHLTGSESRRYKKGR